MRSGRLLSVLLTLQVRGRATARTLAHELEVSERTVHRDMEALAAAGVPVYTERGRNGGWVLADGYRAGPPGLEADELRALFLATPGSVLGDLGLDRASESALTKMLLALPAAERTELAQQRQKVMLDIGSWRSTPREAVPCLPLLHEALLNDRKVQLCYLRADGVLVEPLVDPLGLVAKGLVWYLVARSDGYEARTYRVSRVQAVQVTQMPVEVPEAFDLAEFWAASKNRLVTGVPRMAVVLRADPQIVEQFGSAGRWSRVDRIGGLDPDGRVRVEMTFELEEDVCAFVLSFGPRVELLEPAHLRQRVAAEASAVAALY